MAPNSDKGLLDYIKEAYSDIKSYMEEYEHLPDDELLLIYRSNRSFLFGNSAKKSAAEMILRIRGVIK